MLFKTNIWNVELALILKAVLQKTRSSAKTKENVKSYLKIANGIRTYNIASYRVPDVPMNVIVSRIHYKNVYDK